MLISIGILAWNEEERIAEMLASLFQQSVFFAEDADLDDMDWEIVIVPNGCSDQTENIARNYFSTHSELIQSYNIKHAVHELSESGKSNAWNHYIHELSSPEAELIIMIDADIEFREPETIANTVLALLYDHHAEVAVDMPLKDAIKKSHNSLIEKISIQSSYVALSGRVAIAGSFYCARSEILRKIWMPKGLSGEDGFLKAMVITNCFREPEDETKVIRVDNASHYYETLNNVFQIFRHEVRLVIGTSVNSYLTWDFLKFAVDPNGPGAGTLIRNRVMADPDWYEKFITNSIRNRGFWVLPKGMLFRRFKKLMSNDDIGLAKKLSVATLGLLIDLPIFLAANYLLKSKKAIGYW
ncbi:MAG: glycosyltransferase family 2 protein [Candidatus Sedimenticola sp. (ex Thyasira tokunagai)]